MHSMPINSRPWLLPFMKNKPALLQVRKPAFRAPAHSASCILHLTQKASSISAEGFLRRRRPTLPHCGAVPSARSGLTSLFGMGRGGTPRLKPPKYFVQFIIKNSKFIIILSIYYSLLTTNSSFLIKNSVRIGIDCGKKKRSENRFVPMYKPAMLRAAKLTGY